MVKNDMVRANLSLMFLLLISSSAMAQVNPARQAEEKRGTISPADGPWSAYDRKGYLIRQENYKNYRLDGDIRTFFPSGAVKEMTHYVDGFRQGPYKTYYENGGLESESINVNNNLQGESRRYYKTGELESVVNYNLGNLEGDKKVYFKNGSLKQIVFYKKGLIDGAVLTYGEDGQALLEENYRSGVLTSRKEEVNGAVMAVVPPANPVAKPKDLASPGPTATIPTQDKK
ncbi:MAG: toxin-antitoxin system YwqK family antitoxin [Candidatus Omnitrophota bacterium]